MTHDDEVFIEIANRIRERHMEFENITLAESFMPRMADRIEALSAENERLRGALREVFEQWAGSEGFIPKTAPEGYLLHLTKRMADIARAALGETK